MDELIGAQKRILDWAQSEPCVLALFWYGSYSIGCSKADSDLDVAVLYETDTAPSWVSIERALGNVRMKIGTTLGGGSVSYFLGASLRRIDISWADREEGLAWLADCPEVPEPRLVLAFERNRAGQGLATRAAARLTLDLPRRAYEEIEKFVEAFEAASRAHNRSDAYSFYFQYNLALQRLARLISISRKGPPRLYLVRQLTNTLLSEKERGPFIALHATMDLKHGNQAKLRLQEKFLEFLRELSADPFRLTIDIESLRNFLDAVRIRDAMYNVCDVGV
jgi:hypothetical protein